LQIKFAIGETSFKNFFKGVIYFFSPVKVSTGGRTLEGLDLYRDEKIDYHKA